MKQPLNRHHSPLISREGLTDPLFELPTWEGEGDGMSAAIIPTGVLGWRDDLYYSCRIAAMAFGGATMDCEHTDTAASDFVRWLERRSPIRHFWRRLGGTRRAGGQRSRGSAQMRPK